MILTWIQVRGMSSGSFRVIRCTEIEEKTRAIVPHESFLELREFVFDSSLKNSQIEIGFWRQRNTANIERYYDFISSPTSARMKIFEFVTVFGDDISLTTTASSGFAFPRPPGAFIQSMNTDDVEALWQYHLDGEHFLVHEHGVRSSTITNNDVEYMINTWIQNQGRYISKDPWFWIRAPYWLYIRRFKMIGISVRKQYSRSPR